MDTKCKTNNDLYKVWKSIYESDKAADVKEMTAGSRVLDSLSHKIKRAELRRKFLRYSTMSFGVACGICLCLFAGYTLSNIRWRSAPSEHITEYTYVVADKGGQLLPDGSTVWMGNGSRLRYNSNFLEERVVYLEGNADFNIRHLENSAPLYVKLVDGTIKVKGTSFSVIQSGESDVQVVLHEGRVEFSSADGSFSRLMVPGERLDYNAAGGFSTVSRFFSNIHWIEGGYKLVNTPVCELEDFLNWKYGGIVEIKGLKDEGILMNGAVGYGESVESAIEKISWALKLKTVNKDGKYTLSKK